jgi:predicted lipoprotein with Yx(FWY)xxD motif
MPQADLGRSYTMKTLSTLFLALLFALAGCGGDDDENASTTAPVETAKKNKDVAAPKTGSAAPKTGGATPTGRVGTKITLGDSEYGSMLFASDKQAIYIFERDSKGKTVCYDECAEAWPPVFTKGKPRAAKGVEASLLGTIKRRDGRSQVTYDGKPLYFYAHEKPGEVRCHNVNLNGGLWWVVGPSGKRRA